MLSRTTPGQRQMKLVTLVRQGFHGIYQVNRPVMIIERAATENRRRPIAVTVARALIIHMRADRQNMNLVTQIAALLADTACHRTVTAQYRTAKRVGESPDTMFRI